MAEEMTKVKKKNEKTETIRVEARFEVVFYYDVTNDQFEQLDAEKLKIEDVVDESVAYSHLSNDGTCEMEWDYGPPKKPIKPKRVKKK
jgi:hypothetical protein